MTFNNICIKIKRLKLELHGICVIISPFFFRLSFYCIFIPPPFFSLPFPFKLTLFWIFMDFSSLCDTYLFYFFHFQIELFHFCNVFYSLYFSIFLLFYQIELVVFSDLFFSPFRSHPRVFYQWINFNSWWQRETQR